MSSLIGTSHLMNYTRQTRKLSDSFYFYCLETQDRVFASAGTDMVTDYDKLVGKTGGAVLRPENTHGVGLHILTDKPNIETMVHAWNDDIDFSALYPNLNDAYNISKETKLSTAVQIEGHTKAGTQRYHSLLGGITANSVLIGERYYGLGNYTTVGDIYKLYQLQKTIA